MEERKGKKQRKKLKITSKKRNKRKREWKKKI